MNIGGRPKRLVLYFDLNKTIIMKDTSKGLGSVQLTLSNIIAKVAWGKMVMKKIDKEKEELQWQLAYDQLSTVRPPPTLDDSQDLMTYREYLDKYFPLKTASDIPDAVERGKANAETESIREQKLLNFTKPGNPGVKFKNHFEKMNKALNLPKAAKEELGITDDLVGQGVQISNPTQPDLDKEKSIAEPSERKETSQLSHHDEDQEEKKGAKKEEDKQVLDYRTKMEIFGEGKYHLIPSFFRTLIYLKKAKREFSIVFRTFGEDLSNAIYEFNMFCNGEHPCYNGRGGTPLVKFDGSKDTKDLRIRDHSQKALYYRYSMDVNDSMLVTGTLKRTNKSDSLEEFYSGDIEEGSVVIYRDPIDQFVGILDILKKRSVLAIQDDYETFKLNNYHKNASKLMLIDQADYGTLQIFMDDNVDDEDKCIVDVRDVVTGDILPYKKFMNKYVMQVEPHRAISEPDYFIKLIEAAEANRDEEVTDLVKSQIERVEQGLDTDEDKRGDNQDSEWQKLMESSNEEFLMRTVLPVLYQGMKVVDLERPASPLEFLAVYLLKNQDQVKLPPKPQHIT